MNSKNLIICILCVLTIGLGIYAWKARAQVTELTGQVASLQKAASERGNFQRRGSEQRQRSESDMPPGDGEPRRVDMGGRGDMQARVVMGGAALLNSPEAAKLMASQQRGMLDSRYSALFKSLNLPADQLSKMKDLLVEKQNAARDVMAIANEQGLDMRANRAEIQQLIKQASDDVDASIATLIGTDKYAQYQNFDQTQPQRTAVSQIEQRLSYTAEPLSSAQSEQLVSLLAANSSTQGREVGGNRVFALGMGGGFAGINIAGSVEITNQVIRDAQSFLSPAQVDALRQLQAEQNDQRQLQQMLMNNAGGGGRNFDGASNGGQRSGGRKGRGGNQGN